MRKSFIPSFDESQNENKKRFFNLLLIVTEVRALLLLFVKYFHIEWTFQDYSGIPLSYVDFIAVLVFPTLVFLNLVKPKAILSYFYLISVLILTGSNLWESYTTSLNILTVITLIVPISAASFIAKPVISVIFSFLVCVEISVVAVSHSSIPDTPLLITIVFIGFMAWYTVRTWEQTYNKAIQNESKYLKLAGELEIRVQEKLKELEIVRNEREKHEKFAILGKFVGTISHDLRSPLNVIINSIAIFEKNFPHIDEASQKWLDLAKKSTDRAMEYLNELLNFIRIGDSKPVPSNVNQIVKKVMSSLDIPKNISIEYQLSDGLPDINVDPIQIQRAFQNIITNAVQAMGSSGDAPGKLSISTTRVDDSILVEISDTGPGIPDDKVSKIFEPFFSTKSGGIGLGLAATKDIVMKNQGDLSFRTKVGIGTTFTISLHL